MKETLKILIGATILAGLGYCFYRYYVPPVLTVYSINPLTGVGNYQFGSTAQQMIPGGTANGGFGWTLTFAGFLPSVGWTVQIFRNSALYQTIVVGTPGIITL